MIEYPISGLNSILQPVPAGFLKRFVVLAKGAQDERRGTCFKQRRIVLTGDIGYFVVGWPLEANGPQTFSQRGQHVSRRIAAIEHGCDFAIGEGRLCILHEMGEPGGTGGRGCVFRAYQQHRAVQRGGDPNRRRSLFRALDFYRFTRRGLFGQPSFPIATAVSDIRLEKPHSLSYHDRMRTRVPSMTVVWVRSKVELA